MSKFPTKAKVLLQNPATAWVHNFIFKTVCAGCKLVVYKKNQLLLIILPCFPGRWKMI